MPLEDSRLGKFLWSLETGDPLRLKGSLKSSLSMPTTGSVEKDRVDPGGPTLLPNTQPCPWFSLSVWDLPP